MFDIGASELLMIVIVAVVVIGPKDMPRALRTAGRWIGKMRKVSNHFRSGIDAMVREAELEELERKWREQNEAILKAHPQTPTLAEVEAAPAQFGQISHHGTEMEPIVPPAPPVITAPEAPPVDEPAAAPSTGTLPPP